MTLVKHYTFRGLFHEATDLGFIRNYFGSVGVGETQWDFLGGLGTYPADFSPPQRSLEETAHLYGGAAYVTVFIGQGTDSSTADTVSASWGDYPYGTTTAIQDDWDNEAFLGPFSDYPRVERAGSRGRLGNPNALDDGDMATMGYMRYNGSAGLRYRGDPDNAGTDILIPWAAFAADPVVHFTGIRDDPALGPGDVAGWFDAAAIPWFSYGFPDIDANPVPGGIVRLESILGWGGHG